MGFLSLLPILMAVTLALYTKRAVFSLFCGLLCAAILINIDQPLMGIFYVFDPLLISALADGDSMKVIFFSLLIAIGVEIMRQSGGTQALVAFFLRFTKTRRGTMLTTWFAGLVIFFDDYANCLIVGSSMRSVADKARISREKLAYLVDSTAAPVATLALISTWIGYEVSLMDKAMNTIEQVSYTVSAPKNTIYICDSEHQLIKPSIILNKQEYQTTKIDIGWKSEPSSFPSSWSLQIRNGDEKSSIQKGKNDHKAGSVAVSYTQEKLTTCNLPTYGYISQKITTIYPQATQEKTLTLTLPHHPDLEIDTKGTIIEQQIIDGRISLTLAKPEIVHFMQGEKRGSITSNGAGIVQLEWFDGGIRMEKRNAYAFFIEGLPYRFYPILALVFGFCIAASGRDFGPMFDAEQKRLSQKQEEETDTPFSWGAFSIAVIPLFILITYTGLDLYLQGVAKVGSDAPLFAIIGEADGYTSMLKGAIAFAFSTAILALLHRTPTQTIQKSISQGGAHLAEPLCVLALAWALGNAISELNTAQYLVGLLQQSLPHALLPSIVFVLAAGISFATGTSFGTMGTLMPLALPLAIQLQTTPEICLATAAAVLSGATWGDHCSPISDTTILSSAGAGCEHVSHVRTQLPYALTSGVISLLCCSLPIGFGIHWSICLLAGSLGCISWIFWRGRVPQEIIKEQESLPEESHSNSF